jgi:membrane protein implicated in regulation of membrane protease activity
MAPFVRYALFQLPGTATVVAVLCALWWWGGLPGWMAAVGAAAWIGKDLAMYPLLRRSHERVPTGAAVLIGRRAVVRKRIAPAGIVACGAEVWRAELHPGEAPLQPGAAVRVVGARGLTLIVAAEKATSR